MDTPTPEMIIKITPNPAWSFLDIIIEEQAAYYGQRNAHIIDYLRTRVKK
ncbi:hypothetical protein HYP99_gp042 [Sinorhizobium phage ort11]|uniref:Uncharacterized protein n=1 Tax=Sinorhizobium phage ort11 TaxID=2599764 RepID=A0A5C2H225_9CAUD|nr:hypothetical protein HYP99_gp042 [Sinorhizobium phage ort11]QEP29840.1 hypothetical protein Smphiort11_042 [Sinorhizobium phage ort11]